MQPLVSVITPTADRPELLMRCIGQFMAQDYPNKEMIIVENQLTGIGWKLDVKGNPIYFSVNSGTIAQKRNQACSNANGQIIVHFDDDDLYAPDWITRSVSALRDADLTGLSSAYFAKPNYKAWQYTYDGKQPYVCGATMAYWKATWERNPFKEYIMKRGLKQIVKVGEDAYFCANAGRIVPHDYIDGFCAIMHERNTAMHSAIRTAGRYLKEVPLNQIPLL